MVSEYLVAALILAFLAVFVLATNRNCRRRRPARPAAQVNRTVRPSSLQG